MHACAGWTFRRLKWWLRVLPSSSIAQGRWLLSSSTWTMDGLMTTGSSVVCVWQATILSFIVLLELTWSTGVSNSCCSIAGRDKVLWVEHVYAHFQKNRGKFQSEFPWWQLGDFKSSAIDVAKKPTLKELCLRLFALERARQVQALSECMHSWLRCYFASIRGSLCTWLCKFVQVKVSLAHALSHWLSAIGRQSIFCLYVHFKAVLHCRYQWCLSILQRHSILLSPSAKAAPAGAQPD